MKKICVQSDHKFEAALDKLKDINPGFGLSVLIRTAVIAAANKGMEIGLIGSGVESNTNEGIERRKKSLPKDDWCGMFGGEMKDGVCSINKYEVISTGQVRKNVRAVAVSAFPPDVNEFKRSVLGSFGSVEEAEAAYLDKPLA